jgi:hypothetical protein
LGTEKQTMKYFLYSAVALCVTLSGGGGGGNGNSTADIAPVIRFIGTFDVACPACRPARDNTLTIAPNTGATTLGNRDIAKLELSVDRGPMRTLTAPNSRNTAGLSTWRTIPAAVSITKHRHAQPVLQRGDVHVQAIDTRHAVRAGAAAIAGVVLHRAG